MQIVLRGRRESQPSDTLVALPPAPLDHQIIKGPASKQRREDLQIQSFVLMLGLFHDYCACLEILNGDDPPDRLVRIAEESIAVELTELTFGGVRGDFAQVRKFARRVGDALQARKDEYPHLAGRTVQLSFLRSIGDLPRDLTTNVRRVLEILSEDRGFVGEDLEGLDELPSFFPQSHRGFYENVGPITIQVYRNEDHGQIIVVGSAQAEFLHSELRSTLRRIIEKKDISKNQLLLISCGQPDEKGCACPLDKLLFDEVPEILGSLEINPEFLKCIILHLWGTEHAIELFRAEDYAHSWPPKWPTA